MCLRARFQHRQAQRADREAQTHALSGTTYDQVISLSRLLDVDLILIGAHRPGFTDYLPGSNAARVVRHATTSVLVLRDEGCVKNQSPHRTGQGHAA
ncbi:MAG: universal stress protein [Roseovarius sp.]